VRVVWQAQYQTRFGFPLCRSITRWSFTIKPDYGWTDIRDSEIRSGPTFEVPNHDLSSNPASYSYKLSNAYRFDEPGEYHVTLTVTVGLDDESTQHPPGADPCANPHFVTLTPEIVLQIVAKSNQLTRYWKVDFIVPVSQESVSFRPSILYSLIVCSLHGPHHER
jgi:hypothetical protein